MEDVARQIVDLSSELRKVLQVRALITYRINKIAKSLEEVARALRENPEQAKFDGIGDLKPLLEDLLLANSQIDESVKWLKLLGAGDIATTLIKGAT